MPKRPDVFPPQPSPNRQPSSKQLCRGIAIAVLMVLGLAAPLAMSGLTMGAQAQEAATPPAGPAEQTEAPRPADEPAAKPSAGAGGEPQRPAINVPPASGPYPALPGSEVTPLAAAAEPETVEADISTRSVAVTSAFSGTEIVIFGAIDNSRQEDHRKPLYDVVIVVEGTHEPLISRRKSWVGGIWINTKSVRFEDVPSYYTIYSTRPIEEIAPRRTLRENAIGFDHVVMRPSAELLEEIGVGPNQLAEFKDAVVRLKRKEGLYKEVGDGVEFIGKSLFRSTVQLPANVPVGPLATRIYLFRDGQLLTSSETKVTMRREGLEKLMHGFAFQQPFLYGVFAVFMAVISGLLASAIFSRKAR